MPNLGLNVVSINLGITYKLKNDVVHAPLQDSMSLWGSKHEIVIWDAVGFNENEPPT